jgi:hypothetical protein
MVIFIKKIKTKEGINSIDLDKVRKGMPSGYSIAGNEPLLTYTANHVIVAFNCKKETVQKGSKTKK